MKKQAFFAAALAAFVLSPACSAAKIVYVKWDSTYNGPGGDWTHAYHTVTAGLAAATSGDEVRVARGTYNEAVRLSSGIILTGGWVGVDVQRPSFPRTAPDPYETVIDASGQLKAVITTEFYSALSTTIDGFTLQNGDNYQGGGINCLGSATITHNIVRNNSGTMSGGGIYCVSACVITNNTVSGNTTTALGGGIAVGDGATVSSNSVFGNRANHGGGVSCNAGSTTLISANYIHDNQGTYNGGGIYVEVGSPSITGNTISANVGYYGNPITSEQGGGGIALMRSSATISNNNIYHNDASSSYNQAYGGGILLYQGSDATITGNNIETGRASWGGGIYCSQSSPTVTGNGIAGNWAALGGGGMVNTNQSSGTFANNIIGGNTTDNDGGGIYTGDYSYPIIRANRISANSAKNNGGGIYCFSNPIITDNMFWVNSAYRGGAIYCWSDYPAITNNTVVGSACADQAAVYIYGGHAYVQNTIVAFNSSGIYVNTAYASPTLTNNDVYSNTSYNYSGIADQTGSNGNISVDPLFVDKANYDYHLTASSPCINAGLNSAWEIPDVDYDGDVRIFGGVVDIGADEYVIPVETLTSGVPATRTTCPATYSFQVASGKWAAVGLAPAVSQDLQAADNPFMHTPYQQSTLPGTIRDFIVADGHDYGDVTHYAQVYNCGGGSYSIEADWQPGQMTLGTPVSGSFVSGSVLDTYQVDLTSGTTYGALLHVTSGNPQVSAFIYKPSRVNANRAQADFFAVGATSGGDAKISFTAPETGSYGVVVVSERSDAGSYQLTIAGGPRISGVVESFAGVLMTGVTVTASNGGGSATSGTRGYAITVPPFWSGTVSASRLGSGFLPVRAYTNLAADQTHQDFKGGAIKTIGSAKMLADGSSVYLPSKVLTATFGSDSYIEETNRSSGILAPGVTPSSTSVSVGGVMATVNGERQISSAMSKDEGAASVDPLGMRNKALGGAAFGPAPTGLPGGAGLNNVGMLVKTWGVVTSSTSGFFSIDDGSNVTGGPAAGINVLTVDTDIPSPRVGRFVTVTGICTVAMNGTTPYPLIKPRSSADIEFARRNVLYIRGATDSNASGFAGLLSDNGMPTTVIQDNALSSSLLAGYDAFIVSNSTTLYNTLRTVELISRTGKPVVGIGANGARYFDALSLAIGYSHCATFTGTGSITPRATASPIFHIPNEMPLTQITPFNTSVTAIGPYFPNLIIGVTRLASAPAPADDYYPLCAQGNNILWGFSGGVSSMTTAGRNLFVNTLWAATGM